MSTLLLEPLPAADRRGGVWDYISPSRLNLWLRCPLAFKLQYVDGIRMPATPSLFLGKAVHDGYVDLAVMWTWPLCGVVCFCGIFAGDSDKTGAHKFFSYPEVDMARKTGSSHALSRIGRDWSLDLERNVSCWKSCIRERATRRFDEFAVVG